MIELTWYSAIFIFLFGLWIGSFIAFRKMMLGKMDKESAFDKFMMFAIIIALGPFTSLLGEKKHIK